MKVGPYNYYQVLQPITLSFLTPQDQYDRTIKPEDDITIGWDGEHTIFTVNSVGERKESITVAYAITVYLERGSIKEIPWE